MNEQEAWFQGWPVTKAEGPGRGWWGPPKGTHTGDEGESVKGEVWATSATEWIDKGRTIPPEIYDGLPHRSFGKIGVKKYKDGTYTVTHSYPEMKAKTPLATRADKTTATDQCIRAYGKILNNEPSTVIK